MKHPVVRSVIGVSIVFAILLYLMWPALSAKGYDPEASPTAKWMESLLRPDFGKGYSCCGKADAYPVSHYWKNPDGSYTAVILDGSAKLYPDGTERPYVAAGTEVIVPASKINPPEEAEGNPTEYSWLFLRMIGDQIGNVFCFVPRPTGG